MPLVFCFAGQGSQYYHMAADLLAEEPVFRQWMDIGDAIVRDRHAFSPLAEIHASGRRASEPFDRLEHTHPAIFMTQFAMAKLLQHKGLRPDMLLGVSLGEFAAMSVAGMVPFETALAAVARQPRLFLESCAPGALIAVLGPPSLRESEPRLGTLSELTGINAERHHVLAMPGENVAEVETILTRLDAPFQRLPVPFAFHSSWIEPARAAVIADAASERLESPFWPVWSACLGAPVQPGVADLAWRIVREPMRLGATVAAIEAQGGAHYIDLSATGSLAAIIRQDLGEASRSRISAVLSPFGGNLRRLAKLLETA